MVGNEGMEKKMETIITLGSGLWALSCEVARGAELTFRVFGGLGGGSASSVDGHTYHDVLAACNALASCPIRGCEVLYVWCVRGKYHMEERE